MIEDTMFDNDYYALFVEQGSGKMAINALNALPTHREESQRTQGVGSVGWIPCSERLPKENECVGNVWKYYLIQDEYEDMHVAHLSGRGWETIESVKALGCDVVAWMPSPKPYREGGEV